MLDALKKAGFNALKPQGSYFIMCDWRGVAPSRVTDDVQFAHWLTKEIGVACIPAEHFLPGRRQTPRQIPRAFFSLQKGRDARRRGGEIVAIRKIVIAAL